jgi:photosystem II stability/assembly factor-like uncharacterized protein
MTRCRLVRTVLSAAALTIAAAGEPSPLSGQDRSLVLASQSSGSEVLLQAVSAVSDDVVWGSGHDATYVRTMDGGEHWEAGVVPSAGGLQFRDVAAFDARTAYLMSAGVGAESRIYRTDDGGASWTLQHTAENPEEFFDCMDFWSPDQGLVYGDAVDGVPFLLRTSDGGRSWSRVPASALPAALEGEGGFAASGTCVTARAGGAAWVAMGSGERARVLRTEDYGASWTVADVPVTGGAGAGLTTVQMSADGTGITLGGVIGNDSIRSDNVAVTTDAGATWRVGGALAMAGPVYGSSLVPGGDGVAVAVGPGGIDWSTDGGMTWRSVDPATHWAVAFSSSTHGWAMGPGGRISKLTLDPR